MSINSLVLVGENTVGGTMTLRKIPAEKKEIVFYGRNFINGKDVPRGIHDIPEGTSIILIDGIYVRFKNEGGDDLKVVPL